jgi:DNA-binding MarR family transcriptional regulator
VAIQSPQQRPPDGQSPQRPPDGGPLPALAGRLGYLMKHAHQRLAEFTNSALAPFGISGRECAVLIAIDDRAPLSQQEVARRLGVDRTTMVALIDDLEHKGLVQRRQDPSDRRKNVVVLTDAGHATVRQATAATEEAERRFLAPLSGAEGAAFAQALRTVAFPPSP